MPSDLGDAAMAEDDQPGRSSVAPERKKQTITYDNYIKMVNLFVQRINEDEATIAEGVEGEELINWYLEQKEDELEGEEDYHREKALANMVLKKMVKVSLTYTSTYLNSKTDSALGKYSHGSTRRGSHRWRSKLFNSWPSRLRSTSQLCPGGSLVPCH